MKVLIKDSRSGQYLAAHGTWTTGADHARDFGSADAARAVLPDEKVPRLLVVLYFEDVGYSVNVRKGATEHRFPPLVQPEIHF
jgi:hypothetical protein